MTGNQIAYWTLQETRRSNQAKENETVRSNKVKENETERSNKARESETTRSNLINEGVKEKTLQETRRHNRESELLDVSKANSQAKRWEDQSEIERFNATTGIFKLGLGAATNSKLVYDSGKTNIADAVKQAGNNFKPIKIVNPMSRVGLS